MEDYGLFEELIAKPLEKPIHCGDWKIIASSGNGTLFHCPRGHSAYLRTDTLPTSCRICTATDSINGELTHPIAYSVYRYYFDKSPLLFLCTQHGHRFTETGIFGMGCPVCTIVDELKKQNIVAVADTWSILESPHSRIRFRCGGKAHIKYCAGSRHVKCDCCECGADFFMTYQYATSSALRKSWCRKGHFLDHTRTYVCGIIRFLENTYNCRFEDQIPGLRFTAANKALGIYVVYAADHVMIEHMDAAREWAMSQKNICYVFVPSQMSSMKEMMSLLVISLMDAGKLDGKLPPQGEVVGLSAWWENVDCDALSRNAFENRCVHSSKQYKSRELQNVAKQTAVRKKRDTKSQRASTMGSKNKHTKKDSKVRRQPTTKATSSVVLPPVNKDPPSIDEATFPTNEIVLPISAATSSAPE